MSQAKVPEPEPEPKPEPEPEPEPDESSPASYPPDPNDTPALPVDTDAGATRALSALLKLSPFLDLHQKAGMTADHPVRERVCFFFDFLIRLVVVVILLAVIVAIAWKTLAPLPDL